MTPLLLLGVVWPGIDLLALGHYSGHVSRRDLYAQTEISPHLHFLCLGVQNRPKIHSSLVNARSIGS
jgi:hypothetical protein